LALDFFKTEEGLKRKKLLEVILPQAADRLPGLSCS
jgi:hypothetical protein